MSVQHATSPACLFCAVVALACALCASGCDKSASKAEGVIVRQVLHNTGSFNDAVADAAGELTPKVLQPGQVATTLVSDTPQAAFKQATETARRTLEATSPRQALSQLESQIEQEQENAL